MASFCISMLVFGDVLRAWMDDANTKCDQIAPYKGAPSPPCSARITSDGLLPHYTCLWSWYRWWCYLKTLSTCAIIPLWCFDFWFKYGGAYRFLFGIYSCSNLFIKTVLVGGKELWKNIFPYCRSWVPKNRPRIPFKITGCSSMFHVAFYWRHDLSMSLMPFIASLRTSQIMHYQVSSLPKLFWKMVALKVGESWIDQDLPCWYFMKKPKSFWIFSGIPEFQLQLHQYILLVPKTLWSSNIKGSFHPKKIMDGSTICCSSWNSDLSWLIPNSDHQSLGRHTYSAWLGGVRLILL